MLALVPKVALSTYGVELYRSLRAPNDAAESLRVTATEGAASLAGKVFPCSAVAVGILE